MVTVTNLIQRAALSSMIQIPSWATVNPTTMGTTAEPYAVSNLVGGEWTKAENIMTIPHPMNKDMNPIFTIPDTQVSELGPFLESLQKVPKSGVHNPLKNPQRYVQYGEISRKVCVCACVFCVFVFVPLFCACLGVSVCFCIIDGIGIG
jgi:hypothetical protein